MWVPVNVKWMFFKGAAPDLVTWCGLATQISFLCTLAKNSISERLKVLHHALFTQLDLFQVTHTRESVSGREGAIKLGSAIDINLPREIIHPLVFHNPHNAAKVHIWWYLIIQSVWKMRWVWASLAILCASPLLAYKVFCTTQCLLRQGYLGVSFRT